MSGQPYRNALDIAKFRNEYLSTLALQAQINDQNLQANKIFQRTGAPTQPTDTRTTSEKLADLLNLRIKIRSDLSNIMSGDDAQRVSENLDENEIRFLAQQLPTIIADLKPKFSLGVPSDIFNQYLQRYMQKYQETQGVEYGLQQQTGQQILANQDLILRNTADKTDIDNIQRAVYNLGLQNTALGKQLTVNLNQIQDVLDILPDTFDAINQSNNSILKVKMLESINGIVNELPTKQQLVILLNQLSLAQEKRDVVTTETILKRIAELTNYSGDIQEEIRILKNQIKSSELPVATAEPLEMSSSSSSSASFITVPYAGTNYTYIPPEYLDTMKKSSKYAGINLEDYVRAMYKINELDTLIIFRKKTIDTVTGLSKDKLVKALKDNNDTVLKIWTNQPQVKVSSSGKGVSLKPHKMKGKGISIDLNSGILPSSTYVPFGRYLINKSKLNDGIIMIKHNCGAFIPDIQTKRVSPKLLVIFKKISGGTIPSFDDYEQLNNEEREYLAFVSKRSNLADKLNVPSPHKTQDEQLINQFEIMRGQILAGNDSKELLKKFKRVLVQMSEKELIPKQQLRDILLEIIKVE